MKYDERFSVAFNDKLKQIADDWKLEPDDIIALYNHESGGNYLINPPVGSPFYGKYHGLFGFYIEYADKVADSHNLRGWKNDPLQQLKLHYYMQNSLSACWKKEQNPQIRRNLYYLSNFLPAALLDYVNDADIDKPLQYQGLSAYSLANSNPGFDLNKDKMLTLREIFTYYDRVFKKKDNADKVDVVIPKVPVIFYFIAISVLIFLYKFLKK